MGTEVLRSQDYFAERIRVAPSCRRRSYNYYGNYQHAPGFANPTPNPKPSNRKQPPVQKKAAISKRSSSVDDVSKFARSSHHRSASASAVSTSSGNNMAMEKVTILRRGESLDSKIKEPATDMIVTGTGRIGPEFPLMVPKQIGIVDLRSPVPGSPLYAGSAFAVSPAPSSLPLPSFSKKKQISFDDSATRDLRRLLRLDF